MKVKETKVMAVVEMVENRHFDNGRYVDAYVIQMSFGEAVAKALHRARVGLRVRPGSNTHCQVSTRRGHSPL